MRVGQKVAATEQGSPSPLCAPVVATPSLTESSSAASGKNAQTPEHVAHK